MSLLNAILAVALSAAPWLLLGLVMAGLIKALVSESLLQRWVGGQGLGSIARAAVIGAPLPLCSCGAIPTALAMYRGGARLPATCPTMPDPGDPAGCAQPDTSQPGARSTPKEPT